MAKPWKRRPWPRTNSNGSRSYILGYRDHLGKTRSKSFPSAGEAASWLRDYVRAERRNLLRDFLLGSDVNAITNAPEIPLREVVLDWLANDADPDVEEGLARATFDTYRSTARKHILGDPVYNRSGRLMRGRTPYAIGDLPASNFAEAKAVVHWLNAMKRAGVGESVRRMALAVLSAALSWAIESEDYGIAANGCRGLVRDRKRRRSSYRAGTGAKPARSSIESIPHRFLLPEAVERIRMAMLTDMTVDPTTALRNATLVSVQSAAQLRNQEAWGLRWVCPGQDGSLTLREVLTKDGLDTGKTAGSARETAPSQLVADDLAEYREFLCERGLPPTGFTFIFPGAHVDGHMTYDQAKTWSDKYFKPAVRRVAAEHPHLRDILGATPYSLRRGGMTLRVRAGEDRQVVARTCGTSVEMLERHYQAALPGFGHEPPRPAEEERRAARQLVFGGKSAREVLAERR